jgi:hypothetical protein
LLQLLLLVVPAVAALLNLMAVAVLLTALPLRLSSLLLLVMVRPPQPQSTQWALQASAQAPAGSLQLLAGLAQPLSASLPVIQHNQQQQQQQQGAQACACQGLDPQACLSSSPAAAIWQQS